MNVKLRTEGRRFIGVIFRSSSTDYNCPVPLTGRAFARRLALLTFFVAVSTASGASKQASPLPNKAGSLKFAAIGDNGTGDRAQYEVARQMATAHAAFPYDLVIMLGDNMYGSQNPGDFVNKFAKPYAALLDAGVKFRASLGNHDRPDNVSYKPYNMDGRYYTYTRNNVRFVVLDSTQMDAKQVQWLETTLRDAKEEWKICYFHHPLYSDAARHGSSVDLRVLLEPIFVRYGVNVVFSGHDHIYERIKPQKGIYYFVSGSAGQLRKGNMRPDDETAAYFDQDQSFMLVEVSDDDMFFSAISRTGRTVDSGVIHRVGPAEKRFEPDELQGDRRAMPRTGAGGTSNGQ
jgi:Calcineurin-like phosphoesterase